MALTYTGQPQNVQVTQGGNDVGASNPLPVSIGASSLTSQGTLRTNSEPASAGAAVSLASNFTPAFAVRGVYVGTGGTVKVDLATGTGISFLNVPDGTLLPIQATLVYSTANGTTASNLVVLG